MRIHSEDCDAPMATSEDILTELEDIDASVRNSFVPEDSTALATMWTRLVKISEALGGILRLHYRTTGPEASISDLESYADELQRCDGDDIVGENMSDNLRIHKYQLDLFHQ